MKKLTVQSLKAIFDFLSHQPNVVMWIRSRDFQRQLYVSPSYEQIWGHPTEQLYEHPMSWNDYLYTKDHQQMVARIDARLINQRVEDHPLWFRIVGVQKQVQFIKDQPFALTNEADQIVAFGGIGEVLSEQEWNLQQDPKIVSSEQTKQMEKFVFGILQNEMRLLGYNGMPMPPSKSASNPAPCILDQHGQALNLTKRELECLSHLIAGKSAKQTAALMNISTRTSEFHINSLKQKAKCRTKLELLSKVVAP